ncbi:calcium-binding protein [Pseudooceanicola sp. C21-150M6]|uniref:calcium-binding protein n=1 Tax=Pseudooceanicola sp. C21-150M6 TaxID=3434355 RepID=UPI003D7F308C
MFFSLFKSSFSWSSWDYNRRSHSDVTYDDIGRGDKIEAGCGDDTFVIEPFCGYASVDGNRGKDTLDLSNLEPDSYELCTYKTWCGDLVGKVVFLDDDGCPKGVLCFSDIECIIEPEPEPEIMPNGYVDGTDEADLIDLFYVDKDGDQIDNGDAFIGTNPGPDYDLVLAGAGNDTIFGVEQVDRVRGGDDDDLIYGGNGDDALFGDADNDEIYGEVGNDKLYGGDDQDVLYGGSGDDRMFGGYGDDTLYGGSGDDVLYGDADNQYEGASGSDIFVFTTDGGHDQIWDFVSGTDFIELDGYVLGSVEPTIVYDPSVQNSFITFGGTTITVHNQQIDMDDFIYS